MSPRHLCAEVINVHQVTLSHAWMEQLRHLEKMDTSSKIFLLELLGDLLTFDHHKVLSHASFYANSSTSGTQQKRVCESSFTSVTCSNGLLSTSDGISSQNSGSSCPPQEPNGLPFKAVVKKHGAHLEGSSIRRDCFHPNPSASRTDSKRPKQYVVHLICFQNHYLLFFMVHNTSNTSC